MTWDIRNANNPATTEGIVTPNRGTMNSATATPHPNTQAQQGTAASQTKPIYAGVDSGAVAFYRWW